MSNVGGAVRPTARRDGRRRSRRSRRPGSPAAWAAIIVADTVVAAQPPSASAAARLGRAALRTEPGGRRRERLERRLVEPDQEPAGMDRDGRRDRPGRADRRLGRRRDLEVLRVRQAVADQRRFEGDDRPAGRQGGRDLGLMSSRSVSIGRRVAYAAARRRRAACRVISRAAARDAAHDSWRAAARCPASAARWSDAGSDRPAARAANQPTRNPASNASPAPVVSPAVEMLGRDLEPRPLRAEPRQDGRALRPALDDRGRRRSRAGRRRAGRRGTPRPRRPWRTGGPVRSRRSASAPRAGRPPATARSRRDRR